MSSAYARRQQAAQAVAALSLRPLPPTDAYCLDARQFAAWATDLYTAASNRWSEVAINQAKVLLIDRYFRYFEAVGPEHQRVGHDPDADHECIFRVFADAYARLRELELTLRPPPLDRPARSRRKAPPAAADPWLSQVIFGVAPAEPDNG